MNIPEGTVTVTAEASDLKSAIAGAAQQLGLQPGQVDYKLDMSHFRSATGVPLARSTVRIIAWNSGKEAEEEPRRARPERPESLRAGRDREDGGEAGDNDRVRSADGREAEEGDDRRKRRRRKDDREPRAETQSDQGDGDQGEVEAENGSSSKPENLRGAEAGVTEASAFAQEWFTGLLERMGVEGTATGTGSADRVHLSVKAERAGRIVGKRGATLGSIRHLLGLALENRFGPMTIDVDVGDDRPREEREPRDRDSRGDRDRGPRGDRGDRHARDRGDRSDRGRGRDRDRGDRRDRGSRRDARGAERGRYPEEKLRALARRAAEKALESGQTITINLELNSFDRRIVHLEVSEMDGVESQSEERTGPDGRIVKYVQIIPQRA